MTTMGGVEGALCSDGAPAKWEVRWVGVVKGACMRAEVKCAAGKNTVEKVAFQVWVFGIKRPHVLYVVRV